MSRHKTTISISEKEFRWARDRMSVNDWDRAGDTKGISRYVQELIRADMNVSKRKPKKDNGVTTPAGDVRRFSTKLIKKLDT